MKKLTVSLLLILINIGAFANESNNHDWSMNVAYNNFKGAMGPIKYYDGTIRYPKQDTTFIGYSLSIKKDIESEYPISIVGEIGKLSGTYPYQGKNHSADITVLLVGPRIHFLQDEKVSPYIGFDAGSGNADVPTLYGLNYDFWFYGLVGGAKIKLTEKIAFNINLQTANNDGATYTRYQYGIDYQF